MASSTSTSEKRSREKVPPASGSMAEASFCGIFETTPPTDRFEKYRGVFEGEKIGVKEGSFNILKE